MSESPPFAVTDSFWVLGSLEYPIYLFLEDGEGAIFEGGIGATAPLLVEQLEQIGIPLGQVRQLVLTHAHPDHVMAAGQLRKRIPGVQIIASEKAAKALASEKVFGFFVQMDQGLVASLAGRGAVRPEHCPPPPEEKQITVDRVVKEGDAITVERSTFQVLETPGHSECSLSFYEPSKKILLISDATGYYMPQDGSWWPNYFADYGAYLRSIERLAQLPAEVLGLSHNAVLRGEERIRDYFAGAIAATRGYHERIVAEAKSGKAPRRIAEGLGSEIHAKVGLMPLEFFQKNCGLLVKLSLKHEGIG